MCQIFSKILFNTEAAPSYYKMGLHCPEITSKAVPGQFIMIKVSNQLDPLLRRPFGIHRIGKADTKGKDKKRDSQLEILYKVVGKGTKLMSEMKEGDEIDILGPAGSGFRTDHNIKTAILIAGGIGVAPLFSLADEIRSNGSKIESILLFLGGKGSNDVLCLEDFEKLGVEVKVATEDGSLGYQGLVTDLLLDYLQSKNYSPNSYTYCFGCGPEGMLEKTSKITRKSKMPCQISLETRMACGIGACLGCAVKTKTGKDVYKKVCKDGPVFDSNEIIWNL